MPIYEYRCSACGHQDEFLQKLSDPVLTQCPSCGKPAFEKQLSAAGFQLKGSGWYATDFKSKPAEKKTEAKAEAKADGKSDGKTETKTDTKPAESKPKTAATTD
jgi:putative FmdB family regulatory protein